MKEGLNQVEFLYISIEGEAPASQFIQMAVREWTTCREVDGTGLDKC